MSRTRRLNTRIYVSVWLEYEGFERFHPEKTLNISRGGVFILSQKPLPVGHRISFQFELPDLPGKLEASGVVVWNPMVRETGAQSRHPRGMGIQFDDLHPDLQHVLDQYVTVQSGLRHVDPRIGMELPEHLRSELPLPESTPVQLLNLAEMKQVLDHLSQHSS